jgi:hypothetical protein
MKRTLSPTSAPSMALIKNVAELVTEAVTPQASGANRAVRKPPQADAQFLGPDGERQSII